MSNQDEWGPWIEHDGRGFPLEIDGFYVIVVGVYTCDGAEVFKEGFVKADDVGSATSWDWSNFGRLILGRKWGKVIRYRIRKPRGMAVLDAIMADTSTPIKEDAQ